MLCNSTMWWGRAASEHWRVPALCLLPGRLRSMLKHGKGTSEALAVHS